MKLADFFIQLGVIGDTKELDKTIKQMETASKRTKDIIKYRKELAKATTDEERAQIKKNFADKIKIENLKKEKSGLEANKAAFMGAVKGITAFVGAAVVAYNVIDRMIGSLSRANQQLITFQRTSGISFNSLNKYASANAAVNANSTIEGTAQSMQRVAQNLWDIRMGRGDISPYQELAYVGGRAFNPMGMSVEQVIENVREAIKNVDDLQATNIITRMGFAPDDLLMLRMSREEFEKINNLFLNPQEREAINKYSLELKKTQLQFDLLRNKALLKIMPDFVKLASKIAEITKFWTEFATKIYDVVRGVSQFEGSVKSLNVVLSVLATTAKIAFLPLKDLYLIIEDIAYGFMGYDSYTKDFLDALADLPNKIGSLFEALGEQFNKLKDAYDNSSIKQFFDTFKNGLTEIFNMKPPGWFIQLMSGNFAGGLVIELYKKLYKNLSKNDDPPDLQAFANTNPAIEPTTISNNTASTINNNSNMDVSIVSNQPISTILSNLNNSYGFTQASYAGVPIA